MKAADSSESGAGTDQTGAQVKAADSLESPAQTASEPGEDADPQPDPEPATARGPSRLRRGWLVGIAAALLVLAGGVGAGGYLALRSHLDSTAIARANVAATEAAKDCVAATQAPDAAAMAASMKKIIDCSTGDFGAQASLYTGMLVEAYQTANVHVKVTDMRAAVERNNSDRSVDVLVAFRVNVSNTDANAQEVGYRLRVRMAPDDGRYKIARLDQVTK
ncbi:hypothetical protein [Mycobacterium decipiens]|uniref:Mce protein n=1 Tax=Mycobacterium decipiens TaxID=1430326 RepID=A0A1X2LY61_9MYCO|nr:hypothetical protein [Mycobacterium decipiens]OSC42143.1 hypothetical protein B8W66_05630 [Mycobacterium decipiens]